jgi:hypothetical protein
MLAISIALSVLMIFASGAIAGTLTVGSDYNTIYLLDQHNQNPFSEGGGSISATLNGQQLPFLYCVDISTVIYVPGTYSTSINNGGQIHGKTVDNAAQVAYLIETYAYGVSSKDQSAALQAAIWHVIYGFNLDASKSSAATIEAYSTYTTNIGTGDISLLAWITPTSADGKTQYQGQVTMVPEPSLILLLGLGLGSVGLAARKYKL